MTDVLFDVEGGLEPPLELTPAPRGTRLHTVPIALRAANRWVARVHRHADPVEGCVFLTSIAGPDEQLHGVAIVGRPLARLLQDGRSCEILRCATDGTHNACSALYAACVRAARALGYRRTLTYTEEGESGSSLRAAGFVLVSERGPRGSWHEESSRRDHGADTGGVRRYRWERRP